MEKTTDFKPPKRKWRIVLHLQIFAIFEIIYSHRSLVLCKISSRVLNNFDIYPSCTHLSFIPIDSRVVSINHDIY